VGARQSEWKERERVKMYLG